MCSKGIGFGVKLHWMYLCYVLKHKWYVFLACCKLGIPWLGIVHDWSRFRPSEWIPYVASQPYSKYNKPADITKAFEYAWNDHQHRNKHHWEYWAHWDYHAPEMRFLPVPAKYRIEMLADWIGYSKARGSDVAEGYRNKREKMILHPETRAWFDAYFGIEP